MIDQFFNDYPGVFFLVYFGSRILLYFLPTIIAVLRDADGAMGTFLINFLLGWTIIGWFVALALSIFRASGREATIRWPRARG